MTPTPVWAPQRQAVLVAIFFPAILAPVFYNATFHCLRLAAELHLLMMFEQRIALQEESAQ